MKNVEFLKEHNPKFYKKWFPMINTLQTINGHEDDEYRVTKNMQDYISKLNRLYRLGNPILPDDGYDELLFGFLKTLMNDDEKFTEFVNTLNEGAVEEGAELKHEFIMGSLDKIKNTEENVLADFLKKYVTSGFVNVSAKVDGISCRLSYRGGALFEAATRGKGYIGLDITKKVLAIPGIPHVIKHFNNIDIRGELVIKKSVEVEGDTNKRNICAGLINRKDWTEKEMSKVSFVAYTVMGEEYSKTEQFNILNELGFHDIAWNETYPVDRMTSVYLTLLAKEDREYFTDGLVICDAEAHNENVYRPKNQKAFKINELLTTTTIKDVVFEGPSKDGYFNPVAIVDPVVLGGATITRATLHNLDYIEKLGIQIGAKVVIQKLNDIIPGVTSVIGYDEVLADMVKEPSKCPCCGGPLVRDGVNYRCMNEQCEGRNIYQVANFLKRIGIEGFAYDALNNELEIRTFKDVISFEDRMNKKLKNHVKFVESLNDTVYNKSSREIFTAMNFEGLGEKLLNKIIDFYGWNTLVGWFEQVRHCELTTDDMYSGMIQNTLPTGIGLAFLDRFCKGCSVAWERTRMFIDNPNYHYVEPDAEECEKVEIKGSFCVTGALEFGSRKEFEVYAKEHGWEAKSSVTKGLNYLVNNDTESNSSKNVKAKKLGISIVSESEFIDIINKK